MAELNSIQIIKDMAIASGVDTSHPDWHEHYQVAREQEENALVERMADLMEDTIKKSAVAVVPDDMKDDGRYDSLKVPFNQPLKADVVVDTTLPIRERTLQAARFLYRSFD